MVQDDDNFLRRWTRRKRESMNAARASAAEAASPLPALPSIDELTFESDFHAFMHAKVDEHLRRMALKKLFSDPRFNVMDGLDIYIDDYSKEDPIPAGMMAQLQHARTTLFGPQLEEEKRADDGAQPVEAQPAPDRDNPEPDHDAVGGSGS